MASGYFLRKWFVQLHSKWSAGRTPFPVPPPKDAPRPSEVSGAARRVQGREPFVWFAGVSGKHVIMENSSQRVQIHFHGLPAPANGTFLRHNPPIPAFPPNLSHAWGRLEMHCWELDRVPGIPGLLLDGSSWGFPGVIGPERPI